MRRRRPSCLACSRATRSAPQAAEQTSAIACISQRASQTRRPTSWTFSSGNRGTCASGGSILRPASATMAVSTIFIFHPVAIAPNELSRDGPALSFYWRTNLLHLLTATLSISRVVKSSLEPCKVCKHRQAFDWSKWDSSGSKGGNHSHASLVRIWYASDRASGWRCHRDEARLKNLRFPG